MTRAYANLDRLRWSHPQGATRRRLREWRAIMDRGPGRVVPVLTSRTRHAVDLRQDSPFADVLGEEDRVAVLCAYRGHGEHPIAA